MIYTTGYTGQKLEDLVSLVSLSDALVIDIRLSADSRHAQWRKASLKSALNTSYVHLPELGNLNYKMRGASFNIKNFEQGFRLIKEYHLQGYDLILMCACDKEQRCHRSLVAANLRAEGLEVLPLEKWHLALSFIKQVRVEQGILYEK